MNEHDPSVEACDLPEPIRPRVDGAPVYPVEAACPECGTWYLLVGGDGTNRWRNRQAWRDHVNGAAKAMIDEPLEEDPTRD